MGVAERAPRPRLLAIEFSALLDTTGQLLSMSPAAAQFIGGPPLWWQGMRLVDFVLPDDQGAVCSIIDIIAVRPHASAPVDFRMRSSTGSTEWFNATMRNSPDELPGGALVVTLAHMSTRRHLVAPVCPDDATDPLTGLPLPQAIARLVHDRMTVGGRDARISLIAVRVTPPAEAQRDPDFADRLRQELAARLVDSVSADDVIGHADEWAFLVASLGPTSREQLLGYQERIAAELTVSADDDTWGCKVRTGTASSLVSDTSTADLIRQAWTALDRATSLGISSCSQFRRQVETPAGSQGAPVSPRSQPIDCLCSDDFPLCSISTEDTRAPSTDEL